MRFKKPTRKEITAWLSKNILLGIVFITGACVLIIEVLATRILSPYFGNTIYTFSGVLTVVLAALSIGYYKGGTLADAKPEEHIFYGIILFGGISVLILGVLKTFVLPFIGYIFSLDTGPLILSIILFALPAYLLGMLSPFAIKLQQKKTPKAGLGTMTGAIFFWSTMGSIFGSLLAGFVCIPRIGISHSITIVGILLLTIGISGFILTVPTDKKKRWILNCIGMCLFFIIASFFPLHSDDVLYAADGHYEQILVKEAVQNGKNARILYLGRSMASAMYTESTEHVFTYTEYYRLYELLGKSIEHALVIGGGAYTVPKGLLETAPNAEVDVLEIEDELIDVSKKYFEVQDNPRLHTYIEDGRRYLHDTQTTYDLIFSDAYSSFYGISPHMTTTEFYTLIKNRLRSNGVFIANVIGDLSRETPSITLSEFKTFRQIFPNSLLLATTSQEANQMQNFIFVGINGTKKLDLCNKKLTKNTDPFFQKLCGQEIDLTRFSLENHTTFTDDYNPVEYFIAKRLQAQEKVHPNGREILTLISQIESYGPRFANTTGHTKTIDLLKAELKAANLELHTQSFAHPTLPNRTLTNVIGRYKPKQPIRLLLSAHFDSKEFADKDTQFPGKPTPGANDNASGVAVLLKIASVLETLQVPIGVDIVFFDGEEGEQHPDSETYYPFGSSYFAGHIRDFYPKDPPTHAIVLDMVCRKNALFYYEKNSYITAEQYVKALWHFGSIFAPSHFKNAIRYSIYADHTPLNQIGIPSVLLIDYDDPHHHTTHDKANACSRYTLDSVYKVLLSHIVQQNI